MHAMVMEQPRQKLIYNELKKPCPNENELLIKISVCGICRTDLHVLECEIPNPKLPLIPGHQIIGTIEKLGNAVTQFSVGQKVGVPWLGNSCGKCHFCLSGRENLCDFALFTGYQIDEGFSEYCHRFSLIFN